MNVMKTSLTIIPMCPRECFPLYKTLSRLVLCYQKDWATLLHFIYFCYLLLVTFYLITKLSVTLILVLAENTLLETAYHILLLLLGFDTITYRKDYDRSPILVGHQGSFRAPLSGSEVLLVSGNRWGKMITTCWNLLSLVTMENNHLRGLFGVSSPRPEPQLFTP